MRGAPGLAGSADEVGTSVFLLHRLFDQGHQLALQRAMVARGALAQRLGPCFGHVFDGEVGHDMAPK
jgi:hypothetical protein